MTMSEQIQTAALNPSDEHPPSRPGGKTMVGAIVLIAALVVYFNWSGVKGILGLG
jgi:hypothetical protein